MLADSARANPRMILEALILLLIINPTGYTIFLVIACFGNVALNKIIKNLLIYSLGRDFPKIILRPKDASPTSCYLPNPFKNNKYYTKDFSLKSGMPSGHAMFSWFIATYFISKIWRTNTFRRKSKIGKIISTILLLTMAIIVSFSRLPFAENCHTYGQVLVGITLGVFYAILICGIERMLRMFKVLPRDKNNKEDDDEEDDKVEEKEEKKE